MTHSKHEKIKALAKAAKKKEAKHKAKVEGLSEEKN